MRRNVLDVEKFNEREWYRNCVSLINKTQYINYF